MPEQPEQGETMFPEEPAADLYVKSAEQPAPDLSAAPDPHPSDGGIRICGLLIGRKRNGYGDDCALYCGLPQGHDGRHGRKIPASEALSLGASDEGAGPGGSDDPSAPQPVCGCPPDNCNWPGPAYNEPPEGCRLAPVHPSEQAEKRCPTCRSENRREWFPDPDAPADFVWPFNRCQDDWHDEVPWAESLAQDFHATYERLRARVRLQDPRGVCRAVEGGSDQQPPPHGRRGRGAIHLRRGLRALRGREEAATMSRVLSPQQEQIIAWLGWFRFPVEAIAECAEVSVGTVHNRLEGKVPLGSGNWARFGGSNAR